MGKEYQKPGDSPPRRKTVPGQTHFADGRRAPSKEVRERNAKLAEETGVALDSLGRIRASQSDALEEEEQRWSNPKNRDEWEMRWVPVPPDDKRCRATVRSTDSPWMGNQCRAYAIHGGVVCLVHGGRLPNVRKAAQRRLTLAAPAAADRLAYIALVKQNVADSDRIKAILAILDRAGVEGKQTIEIEIKPWQKALQSLVKGEDAKMLGIDDEDDYEDHEVIEGHAWGPGADDD